VRAEVAGLSVTDERVMISSLTGATLLGDMLVAALAHAGKRKRRA
jgi:hypothetical protein